MLSISILELLIMILILPLLGGVIGYVVGNDRGSRGAGNDEALAALRGEFDDYKQGVTGHFQETADLMHQMTEQYRTLYTHMAKSAVDLCENEDALPQLEEFKRPGLVIEDSGSAGDGEGDEDARRA